MTSFSRGLSINPVDVLKSNQRPKPPGQPYLVDRKNDGWREFGDDISGRDLAHTDIVDPLSSPTLRKRLLNPCSLHATGHETHLYTRRDGQQKQGAKYYPVGEKLQEPSQKVARGASEIVIPVQTSVVKHPRTVTLKLDPDLDHIQSHRNKAVKSSPRFVAIPKSRYSPKWNCPESSSDDALQIGSNTQLFARGQSSKLSDSHSAGLKHSALQRLASPSPDYMLVAAKFTDDHLILTNEDGLVTQHLTTDVESDSNVEPPSSIMDRDSEAASPGPFTEKPNCEASTFREEEEMLPHKNSPLAVTPSIPAGTEPHPHLPWRSPAHICS